MKQEHQVESLHNCISESQQQTYAQRFELQDAQHGFTESRREQVRPQDELSIEEQVLSEILKSEACTRWGKMKRAQELRVDEVSVQKLRENHETIQQLTSQLQEMQDQMNAMSDSGEFQEGRLSYVSSQPPVIPSSRSMLSRDKRLPLDTWSTSGLQENVFWSSVFYSWFVPKSSRRNSPLSHHKENEDQFHKLQGRELFSQEMTNKIVAQFQCRRSSATSSLITGWNFHRIVWLDSIHRQQISELQFDKFPCPQSFLVWKIRFKNQVATCSDFPSEAMLRIKRSGDGWFIGVIEVLAIRFWKELSKIWDAGREDCFCSQQDHPEFTIRGEGHSQGTESPKGGLVSTRKSDRLHDLWLLSSKIPSDDVLGKSVPMENTRVRATQNCVGIVRHGDSSEIDAPLSESEDNGEEEYRSETSIAKFGRQTRENWNKSSGQESKRMSGRWRRKRYLLPVERKRPVFERRPMQFRAWE